MIEIKKFSDCEFAPNILYEIVKNENEPNSGYSRLKVGGLIRGPNCDSESIVGAYWENFGKENARFEHIYGSRLQRDWKDKIFVKYDKEQVYKTLYNNAKDGYEHFLSIAESYEDQMKRYKEVLSSL